MQTELFRAEAKFDSGSGRPPAISHTADLPTHTFTLNHRSVRALREETIGAVSDD